MAKKHKHPEHVNHERWLVSYADFVTLLFAFFVVMFAVSQVDAKKMGRFTDSFAGAITWQMFNDQGAGLMPAPEQTPDPITEEGEGRPRPKSGPEARAELKKSLEAKLKSSPTLAGLGLYDVRGELVLRLPERLMFDTGDAAMRPAGREAVLAIADELAPYDVLVRVEGHTDSAPIHTPEFPSNWELSGARAMSVLRVLLQSKLLAPARLGVAGYGEHHPIANNANAEGRAQNRRVDIVVVMANRSHEEMNR